jgi:hypothetical protein
MLAAVMAAMAVAGAVALPPDGKPVCENPFPQSAKRAPDAPGPEASFKRLVELPPANLILTVLRTEDGCIVPVIVRYGIGSAPKVDK